MGVVNFDKANGRLWPSNDKPPCAVWQLGVKHSECNRHNDCHYPNHAIDKNTIKLIPRTLKPFAYEQQTGYGNTKEKSHNKIGGDKPKRYRANLAEARQ